MHRGQPYRNESSRRTPRSDPGYWADAGPRGYHGPENDAYRNNYSGGEYGSPPYGPRRDDDWMANERQRGMARGDWDWGDHDPRRSPYGSTRSDYGDYSAYGRHEDEWRSDRARGAGAYRPGDDRERHYQLAHASLYDPEYEQWRRDHMNALDNDYHRWRQERYQKFSDDFNTWRKNRPVDTGTDTDRARTSASSSGSATPGSSATKGGTSPGT